MARNGEESKAMELVNVPPQEVLRGINTSRWLKIRFAPILKGAAPQGTTLEINAGMKNILTEDVCRVYSSQNYNVLE